VVCLQVKLCDTDPHLSALEVRFSRRGVIGYKSPFTFTFTRVHVIAVTEEERSLMNATLDTDVLRTASAPAVNSTLHLMLVFTLALILLALLPTYY